MDRRQRTTPIDHRNAKSVRVAQKPTAIRGQDDRVHRRRLAQLPFLPLYAPDSRATAGALLELQRAYGNQRVQRMLAGKPRSDSLAFASRNAVVQRNGALYEPRFGRQAPSAFERQRNACRNRLNWSDGGHWIGSGPEPDCFGKGETFKRTSTVTAHWPDEESVIELRDGLNQSRNRLGYVLGALTTVITAGASAPLWVALVAGFGSAVGANNLPSFLDKVRSGDTVTVQMDVEGVRSPHPWGRSQVSLRTTITLKDREGQLKWRTSYGETYTERRLGRQQFDRLFGSFNQ
jgi:hypothetical protein